MGPLRRRPPLPWLPIHSLTPATCQDGPPPHGTRRSWHPPTGDRYCTSPTGGHSREKADLAAAGLSRQST
jgi:hypothetical protein